MMQFSTIVDEYLLGRDIKKYTYTVHKKQFFKVSYSSIVILKIIFKIHRILAKTGFVK